MKAVAPERASLQSTPTILPCPSGLREKRSYAGASSWQGPHQLAQNTTSAGCPCALASRLGSVTGAPARCSVGSAGARRPCVELPLEASPKVTNAAIAAAPRAIPSPQRAPLLIGGPYWAASSGTSWAISAGLKLAA